MIRVSHKHPIGVGVQPICIGRIPSIGDGGRVDIKQTVVCEW